MKKIIFILLLLISKTVISQPIIYAGADTTINCNGNSLTLTATVIPQAPITYTPDSFTVGITVPFIGAGGMSDDVNSDAIPIGFLFCFQGINAHILN